MTEEQIDLEYELILLDQANKEGNKDSFEDDEYEQWDNESDELDAKLSDPINIPQPRIPTTKYDEDEWDLIE